jgi:hypothetical protein
MSAYRKGEKISEHYKLEEELGKYTLSILIDFRGSFAVVKGAVNKKTGQKVAIKIIERTSLEEEDELAM